MAVTRTLLLCIFLILVGNQAFANCSNDSEKQENRSKELQSIKVEDQKDRIPPINWDEVSSRDELRRKRVAEIFAEGCFSSTEDYLAAALVFQHGNVADHFFQTFLWAKRAFDLGEKKASHLMALGIDRYLVNLGKKQLFGSQAFKPGPHDCWCLDQVEPTFSEDMRRKYFSKTIEDQISWIQALNKDNSKCENTKFCNRDLSDTPNGTVPGFW